MNADQTSITLSTIPLGALEFSSPGSFKDWIDAEANRWAPFLELRALAGDPIGDLGAKGSVEHAREWASLRSQVESADLGRLDFWRGIASQLEDRINSRGVLLARSSVGSAALSLLESDESIARVAVSLATGRDTQRLMQPANQRRLWRALGWLSLPSSKAEDQEDSARTLASLDASLADARDKERSISDLLHRATTALEEESGERSDTLDKKLIDLETKFSNYFESVQSEWDSLRRTYDRTLALQAPRSYWNKRRVAHRIAAASWGIGALVIAFLSVFIFLPTAVRILESAPLRSLSATETLTAAQATPSVNLTFAQMLPELFQVLVGAFLVLWSLRFLVRQSAQNLSRLQEASVRVTMVETFLALSQPGGDDRILVEEADRAVIIQALFRPSGLEQVDDAPPVHWVEEVFRRVKKDAARQN